MAQPKSEKLLLQAELRRVWDIVDCLIWVVIMCLLPVNSLSDRLAQNIRENDDLKKEAVCLKRMLSVYGSRSHSDWEAVLFAKKRRVPDDAVQARLNACVGREG